ncbi:21126_t:CDS:2, partial [Gigaspora rosea]
MPSIPFNHPNQETNVHNEEGIDSSIIIENADSLFFPHLWLSYTGRKNVFNDLFRQETHDEWVERLLIHSYDDRIEQRKTDRSMENTELVDLKEESLHSTEDYVSALKFLINIPEAETYIKTWVLIAPMDYPGQLYIWRAITRLLKSGDLVLHIVPMIGPLHVSLNSRETVFLLNYDFFDLLFHAVFGRNK